MNEYDKLTTEQLAYLEIDRLEKQIEEKNHIIGLQVDRIRQLVQENEKLTERINDNLIRSFKSAVELLAEKMCTCDSEKMCKTCQMRKQLTWWIVSQAPGITGHPDAGEDDD